MTTAAKAPEHAGGQRETQAPRDGWRIPVALGIGLLGVGGFFVLVALGLSILSSIEY